MLEHLKACHHVRLSKLLPPLDEVELPVERRPLAVGVLLRLAVEVNSHIALGDLVARHGENVDELHVWPAPDVKHVSGSVDITTSVGPPHRVGEIITVDPLTV